jgi:hypothetical protein
MGGGVPLYLRPLDPAAVPWGWGVPGPVLPLGLPRD